MGSPKAFSPAPWIPLHTLHTKGACDNAMLEYVTVSLTTIAGLYPGCGIVLTGDFNRLNISHFLVQFKLKQLVCLPTRGDRTLDLIITNMLEVYDKNLVQIFPPFGLSDHSVVILQPKPRPSHNSSRRVVTRRDTRSSRRAELGRYLKSVDWSVLDTLPGCEEKLRVFLDFVRIGMDIIMPLRSVKLHVNDAPWVTAEFKKLIEARSKAFARGDTENFRRLRNEVNRERKLCRKRYFTSKVANLKTIKPSRWWSEVKKIAGMTPATGRDDIRSQLHLDAIENKSPKDIADLINTALLEPMQEYCPLESLPPFHPDSEVVMLSVSSVSSALLALNPHKASGPDGVPNWVLKEYADFLADPVCSILNSSFAEQRLPSQWKYADVTPLPKVKPVSVVSKHIRPISLTPALSKVAEEFVVRAFVGPAILEIVDPNQFGAIPKSSCVHALVSMLHTWAQATDGTSAAVMIIQYWIMERHLT